MKLDEHIVEFDKYCKDCKNRNTPEEQDPCYECLKCTVNQNTNQPVYFKAGKAIIKKGGKRK